MFSNFGDLITEKPGSESVLFRVSVRAWISIMLTVTVCYMGLKSIEVKEPLYTLATIAIGFYFGRQSSQLRSTRQPDQTKP